MVAEAERLFGPLNAAVLNAGITGGGSIDDLSFEDFQKVISVNLFGAVLGIKAVLPSLRKSGEGAITVTSSTMGLGGDSENWAYGASKHAVIGLVRSLSRELGWEGIRINALCPEISGNSSSCAATERPIKSVTVALARFRAAGTGIWFSTWPSKSAAKRSPVP